MDKQKTMTDIRYDRSGFGSKATTLIDARKKDASITKEDVEESLRRTLREQFFVAPRAHFE